MSRISSKKPAGVVSAERGKARQAASRRKRLAVPALSIRLLHDEVLIRLIHPERHTHNLLIPDSAKRSAGELWRGLVLAVGPGARTPKKGILILPEVAPGNIVGFFWAAGRMNVTKWPDAEHRIIHESDIQWKLEA